MIQFWQEVAVGKGHDLSVEEWTSVYLQGVIDGEEFLHQVGF